MTTITNKFKQRGAVSLFVVVFAALLLTIITVSFVRIMIQDQQQASTTDLSQSAYDSAQAGVEDAKRALLRFQSICNSGGDCSPSSIEYKAISSSTCNESIEKLLDVSASGDEVKVETGGTNALDQAYTCVKIIMQTDNFEGVLEKNTSNFIPLIGVSDFDTIKIDWFSTKDLQVSTTTANIPNFSATSAPLLDQASWAILPGPNRPSIMRAQLIQFNNTGFSLGDFDGGASVNGSNNTLFLYPTNIVSTVKSFASDTRKTAKAANVPTQINCNNLSGAQDYACSATITLPKPVTGIDHTQYLNLTSLYTKANYQVTLWKGSGPVAKLVQFDGVQPEVDSTGRTSDLFRRVKARVQLTDVNFPYPDATVDVTGNLCKDFTVTDDTADYKNRCTP